MSTNDVFLFDRNLSSRINYFKVNDSFDWYSDHKSVSLSIKVNVIHNKNGGHANWKTFHKPKLKWSQEKVQKFKSVLNSNINKAKLEDFCNRNFDNANDAECVFSKILTDALKETFPAINQYKKRQKKKTKI